MQLAAVQGSSVQQRTDASMWFGYVVHNERYSEHMKDKMLIPNLLFGFLKLDLKVWINLHLKPGQPENVAMFKLFSLQLAAIHGVSFP